MAKQQENTQKTAEIPDWIGKLTPYKLLIKPALTAWLWIMPFKSAFNDSLGHFYVSTVLSVLLTAAVWYHERIYTWAQSYMRPFLYPKKPPEKFYELAAQIFHFSLYIAMALAMLIGIAVLSKTFYI